VSLYAQIIRSGPGSAGWHGRAGRADRGRSLRDVISSPAFRNSFSGLCVWRPLSALERPVGASSADRNPPDWFEAQPGQGDVEGGGDLVHLGHRSVAFLLLLRPLLDDLCVHETARELDAETGIGCSVLGVELELGVGEGESVGVDHDARGTLR
jgi:hypothetical protein